VKAKQSLLAAEQAWDAVENDDFTEKLDDARVDMNQAEDDLNKAKDTLSEYDNLDEDNPIRTGYEEDVTQAQQTYDQAVWDYEALQYQYDLAQAQLNAAQKALEDAQQKVDSTQNGPDPDDLALANARLDEARSQLTAAQSALDELTLTAPMDAKVVHLDLSVGSQTAPGQLALVLADFSSWYLETNDLTEDEVVGIEKGDEVSITFDAIPGETFSGVVESISDTFVERFGDITYVVKISLDNMDPRLRWGMTAEVEFVD
jgi:multidrug resistance efflux pump